MTMRCNRPTLSSLYASILLYSTMLLMGLLLVPLPASSVDTEKTHASNAYPAAVEDFPPISFFKNNRIRTLTLADVFDYHGHACPGATVTFMALQYGLTLLYDTVLVNTDDVLVLSGAPGGSMDVLDLFMYGNPPALRTQMHQGIERSADNFVLTLHRVSTGQTVTIALQDGLWPGDWFELREKARAGTMTEVEQKKREGDRRYIIEQFPLKAMTTLFGTPEIKHSMLWGPMR